MNLSSHYRAGTGAVLVETREETRLVRSLAATLPATAQIGVIAAPGGTLKDGRTGRPEKVTGLANAYEWASAAPGRILVIFDWHTLCNAAGQWRGLIDALPGLRSPKGAGDTDPASLAVFVGPSWELSPANPLRGVIPVLGFDTPARSELADLAARLAPLNGSADLVADALCGLTADAAEQAAAECLAAHGNQWNADYLRNARRRLLKEAGLELWAPAPELGGLGGFRSTTEAEILPWLRDPTLSVRRILCAGVPGVGKSFCARWLAGQLGCECARLSIPALKAGTVGASEANLRRALRALDSLAGEAPIVCVLDEIDTIARDGMDGGTSSGMFAELLTWLQESTSQAVVVATLNHLSKLDAALESRFQSRFFFDLPTHAERVAVAQIHYRRLACPTECAKATADYTDGFSSREIAEHICPSVARRSGRAPSAEVVARVCGAYTPASKTQAEQIAQMRRAAASLTRANDDDDQPTATHGRRIS